MAVNNKSKGRILQQATAMINYQSAERRDAGLFI